MNVDIEEEKRNVIPRWRDFKTTLALGELHSPALANVKDLSEEGDISEQIAEWQNNKSLSFATDLVGAGFVL